MPLRYELEAGPQANEAGGVAAALTEAWHAARVVAQDLDIDAHELGEAVAACAALPPPDQQQLQPALPSASAPQGQGQLPDGAVAGKQAAGKQAAEQMLRRALSHVSLRLLAERMHSLFGNAWVADRERLVSTLSSFVPSIAALLAPHAACGDLASKQAGHAVRTWEARGVRTWPRRTPKSASRGWGALR